MCRVMLTATKEFSWDMAHMLANHEGLCQNIHGHTYRMEVTASRLSPEPVITCGPSEGMVVDFKELKEIVKNILVDQLDHAFMYQIESPDPCEIAVVETLRRYGKKVVGVTYRPTAENMAMDFIAALNLYLEEAHGGIEITRIRLWETPTSYAEVER